MPKRATIKLHRRRNLSFRDLFFEKNGWRIVLIISRVYTESQSAWRCSAVVMNGSKFIHCGPAARLLIAFRSGISKYQAKCTINHLLKLYLQHSEKEKADIHYSGLVIMHLISGISAFEFQRFIVKTIGRLSTLRNGPRTENKKHEF